MHNHVRTHFSQVLLDSIKHLATRYSDSSRSLTETPNYLCRKSTENTKPLYRPTQSAITPTAKGVSWPIAIKPS